MRILKTFHDSNKEVYFRSRNINLLSASYYYKALVGRHFRIYTKIEEFI